MSGKSARYQTSMAGMVGAMLVIVVGIVAFVLLRDLNRNEPDGSPEPVEWEAAVAVAQEGGLEVVHPATLPEEWQVTSAELVPSEPPTWGMGMLTDTGAFVGLRQEDAALRDLLEVYVDEDAEEGEPIRLDGPLGGSWETYTDSGGDTALALLRDDDVVLVYGSAPRDVVVAFAESLTDAPGSATTP